MGNRLILALIGAAVAGAAPVDGQRARLVAEAWLAGHVQAGPRTVQDALPWPASGEPSAWLLPLAPEGFALIAADDALRPVLGWSESGTLSAGTPPALAGWLGEVDQILTQVRAAGPVPTLPEWEQVLAGDFAASRDVMVQPLLSVNWNQGDGYNDLCPPDAAGPGGRALVGCVAVSMAQIMHYWQQPRQGTGSHGYNSDYGWLFADFGAATYDWEQIAASSPTAEGAELLYHCGVAVDMMYGADGSGAYVGWGNPCALTAMRDHFGFQTSLQFVQKQGMSWTSWRNRMRTELDAGRPVLLSGYGSGGHAFNLDGWRDDDYFHLNWGWGGSFNGWFLIDQLNPGGQDFSQDQGAVVNLVPVEYQHAPVPVAPLAAALDVPCEPVQFQWEPVDGATGYDLQVATTPDFLNCLEDAAGLTVTERGVHDLDHYTTYYWRVRSHGGLGMSPWTAPRTFTTAYWDQTPTPRQATPLDGSTTVRLNPTVLVWDFVTGGESYDVQVDDAPDFTSLVLDTLDVTTNYVVYRDRLEPGVTYWWRVRCMGLAGESEWSSVRSFTTLSTGLETEAARPATARLAEIWPNPFNPSTRIALEFAQATRASVTVYNLRGERVALLAKDEAFAAGSHELAWEAGPLPSGVYVVELSTPDGRDLRKATLLR